jgi:DNA polymerase-3 subunit alpha
MGFFGDPSVKESENGDFHLPPAEEYPKADLLAFEKEVTGMFLSGHPMAEYINAYKPLQAVRLGELLDPEKEEVYPDGSRVNIMGIVSSHKTKITKSNETMAFLTLEDMFGSLEILVFPKILSQYGIYIKEGSTVFIKGRISRREDEDTKVICETASSIPSTPEEGEKEIKKRPDGLYLKVPNENSPAYKRAKQLLAVFDGMDSVYIYMSDSGKMFKAPASMCVNVNEVLLKELRRVLGERNVVWIDKMQQ